MRERRKQGGGTAQTPRIGRGRQGQPRPEGKGGGGGSTRRGRSEIARGRPTPRVDRRRPAPGRSGVAGGLRAFFRGLRGRRGGNGLGVAAVVVEGLPDGWDVAAAVLDETASGLGRGGDGAAVVRGAAKFASRAARSEIARLLGALGSPHRLAILAKLLRGPATYRALARVTRLKAGPLYHHVNQLRLAGLIAPKQRDVYALTRGGRNALLGAVGLSRLAKDRRPRPLPA